MLQFRAVNRMRNVMNHSLSASKRHRALSDLLFVLWAGGAALLAYSLVYALRKPFTAASFDGLTFFGMDYKVAVSIMQLVGYVTSKFLGIKFISELKPGRRLPFIIGAAALSEISLVLFGLMPVPWNIVMLFFNGLSLGCMWGVIFSFLEGRRTTDLLASMMGMSMAISSGVSKSLGLFTLEHFQVSEFWMPALIGAVAFPLLSLMGWLMARLPAPTAEDVAQRTRRKTLDGRERRALVCRFLPFLAVIFGANLLLTVMRDIKEDFIVRIIDVSTISSWTFAQTDTVATLLMLAIFALLAGVKYHKRVLFVLLALSALGMFALSFIGSHFDSLRMPVAQWLFLQTFLIDIAYLSFQTIFFERFIACFRVEGNVGFFIITIDFVGYLGTLGLLGFKELAQSGVDWATFYNGMNFYVGMACGLAFLFAIGYLLAKAPKQEPSADMATDSKTTYLTPQTL